MILEIVQYPDPVLRAKGKKITQITDDIRELAVDMVETMHDANGVGLAAQQIGKSIQLTVLDVSQSEDRPSTMSINGEPCDLSEWMPMVLVNPELVLGKERELGREGCLSIPEVVKDIQRAATVQATGQMLDGSRITFEAGGLLARALQHEVDHLHGILFVDRMNSADKLSVTNMLKRKQREAK